MHKRDKAKEIMPPKISVSRVGAVVTATDGKLARAHQYKHLRAAILVTERISKDRSFAESWLREGQKDPVQLELFKP